MLPTIVIAVESEDGFEERVGEWSKACIVAPDDEKPEIPSVFDEEGGAEVIARPRVECVFLDGLTVALRLEFPHTVGVCGVELLFTTQEWAALKAFVDHAIEEPPL